VRTSCKPDYRGFEHARLEEEKLYSGRSKKNRGKENLTKATAPSNLKGKGEKNSESVYAAGKLEALCPKNGIRVMPKTKKEERRAGEKRI